MDTNETPLPEPSIPSELSLQVQGYEEEFARKIGGTACAIIKQLSRFMPLESLDGVTIAADYPSALRSLDRGATRPMRTLEATLDNQLGTGIAMAPLVLRDGVTKTHLVLGPAIVEHLAKDDEDGVGIATASALIAHELGHVVDHEWKRRRFGEFAFRPVSEFAPGRLAQYLWDLGSDIWGEYSANRIATNVVKGNRGEVQLFISARDVYRDRIYEARRDYHRRLIKLVEFLEVVASNVRLALLATGYLLGRADGEKDTGEATQEVHVTLADARSADLVAFHPYLADLWDRRETWSSYSDFLCLNAPTLQLLHQLEIFPSEPPGGGLYVDLPIRL